MVLWWESSLRDALQCFKVPPGQAQDRKLHRGQLNPGPHRAGGWGYAAEQQSYPCRAATLQGWMAACSPAFSTEVFPRGDTVAPLEAGSLLLSAVLIAPYPEMLPLTCLQETLHQHPEQANPAQSPGTPCNACSLPGPAARQVAEGWLPGLAIGRESTAEVARAHPEGC